MAKYRHRLFEIYEFRDEATRALSPRLARPDTEDTPPESWTFKHLAVTREADVTHVTFGRARSFGPETVSELRSDFSELEDRLAKDSRILFDFSGVESFCTVAINELDQLRRHLRAKGSSAALCCIAPAVHQSFFSKNQST